MTLGFRLGDTAFSGLRRARQESSLFSRQGALTRKSTGLGIGGVRPPQIWVSTDNNTENIYFLSSVHVLFLFCLLFYTKGELVCGDDGDKTTCKEEAPVFSTQFLLARLFLFFFLFLLILTGIWNDLLAELRTER